MKSHLIDILDTETQNMEFALLGFSLAMVQDFFPMPPFLHFGRVMYILHDCMLEVCNCLFDVTGYYSEEIALSLRRDFGLLSSLETERI